MLAREQLEDIDRLLLSKMRQIETELKNISTFETIQIDELRRATRKETLIRQLFVLDAEGVFIFPPESGEISSREAEFLEMARDLELASVTGGANQERFSSESILDEGWYTWFMGDGLNFVFWRERKTDSENNIGAVMGVILERTALIAEIIAALPDSTLDTSIGALNRLVIRDARGNPLYQWGQYSPEANAMPIAEIPLSHPLGAWHLSMYLNLESEGVFPLLNEYIPLFSGILALLLVVIFLAVYFYRENGRIIRDALQKITFVNQVSHELRTPLTNIRLYAELLESRLRSKKDLDHITIIMSETLRLGRMIGNVLTFSRADKNGFEVHLEEVSPDELIRRVVESFMPALDERSFNVDLFLDAPIPISTDSDFVEQILSNIIGNAEKYAAPGKYLKITSTQNNDRTMITVEDRGPGIPHRERKHIFEPFYRISNRLNDGVAGAGIGLTISRRLAEKMDGELILEPEKSGAVFRLQLKNSPDVG